MVELHFYHCVKIFWFIPENAFNALRSCVCACVYIVICFIQNICRFIFSSSLLPSCSLFWRKSQKNAKHKERERTEVKAQNDLQNKIVRFFSRFFACRQPQRCLYKWFSCFWLESSVIFSSLFKTWRAIFSVSRKKSVSFFFSLSCLDRFHLRKKIRIGLMALVGSVRVHFQYASHKLTLCQLRGRQNEKLSFLGHICRTIGFKLQMTVENDKNFKCAKTFKCILVQSMCFDASK